MRKNIQNLAARFAHLDNEKNWKFLGILYLVVLIPLIIAGFIVITLGI